MAKQLEESHKQLANQVEKAFYEESQKISREGVSQFKTRVISLKNKEETCEVLV